MRQRLSRGLARLRARLDREFDGGRSVWGAALVGLLEAGPAGNAMLALPTSAALAKSLAALAIVAVVLVWWRGAVGSRGVGSKPEVRGSVEVVGGAEPSTEAPLVAPGVAESRGRHPVEEIPPPASGLEIVVRGPEGNPQEGGDVFVLVGGKLLARQRTDGAGRASFVGREGGGDVVVLTPDHPPSVHVLQELRGTHDVLLAPGVELSGWLVEDGGVPLRPVPLTLGMNDDALARLDDVSREFLRELDAFRARREVVTAADGAFCFAGLPANWSGSVRLPRTHAITGPLAEGIVAGWDYMILLSSSPATGLLLHATRLPAVRGRLVDDETGAPMADVGMNIKVDFADGTDTPVCGTRTGDDGRFELGLMPSSSRERERWLDPARRSPVASAAVWGIDVAEGFLEVTPQFTAEEIGPNGDLGDIRVPRGRSLHLLVVDAEGRPIEGAVAAARRASASTDNDGRALLRGLPFDLEEISVGAPAHRIRTVPLGRRGTSVEDPVYVVLEPGNRLELAVVDEAGHPVVGTNVIIEGKGRLFEVGWPGTPSRLHRRLGGSRFVWSGWEEDGGQACFETDAEGKIVLVSIRPDAEWTVEVQGTMKRVLFRNRLRGPGVAESLRHELVIESRPFDWEVAVHDVRGRPLPNVEVRLRLDSMSTSARTGSEGTGRFEDLYAGSDPVELTATLDGYAPILVEGIRLAPNTRLPDLVLTAGVDVRVRVIDEAGAAIPDAFVTALAPGHPSMRKGRNEADGARLLEDLPLERVTLSTSYGLKSYSIEHDTSDPVATIVLPTHGFLVLLPPGDLRNPEEGWHCLVLTSVLEPGLEDVISFGEDGDRATESMPLLPGRYRVHLEHRWWIDGELQRVPLDGEYEVTVRTGEETRFMFDDR